MGLYAIKFLSRRQYKPKSVDMDLEDSTGNPHSIPGLS